MPQSELTEADQSLLLKFARSALAAAVRHESLPEPTGLPSALAEPRGAFVTLYLRGRLRGCIGLMESELPLAKTVVCMASAAACEDPRFAPVSPEELSEIEMEISVLSPLRRVAGPEEIVLGRDGVLIMKGGKSGVFLPQVAVETGWSRERFLTELCVSKAGLPANAWQDAQTQIYTFTVQILKDK